MKTLLIILTAMTIAITATAQDAFFRGGEFSIDGFYQAKTSDFDTARTAGGMGLNFFATESIGLGVSTAIENTSETFIEEVTAIGIYRMPFGRNAISLWAGGEFQLESDDWSLVLGPEAETRLTRNLGAFLRIGIHKPLTGERDPSALVQVGVRIAL